MFLVFGKNGQLARSLSRFPNTINLGRDEFDFCNLQKIRQLFKDCKPEVVLNAAAFTNVDEAEKNTEEAYRINSLAPKLVAKACGEFGIPLVHISTDYVFDGNNNSAWKTDDQTNPLNVYGESKLRGEEYIRDSGCSYVILRTSWVFSSHGNNFVNTMLKLAKTQNEISIIGDQYGCPTSAEDLAKCIIQIANALKEQPNLSGVYHYCGSPKTSWYDFADYVFKVAGLVVTLRKISTVEYDSVAVRPLNSELDCTRTFSTFNVSKSNWRASIDRMFS